MRVTADELTLRSRIKTFMGTAAVKQLTQVHGNVEVSLIFMEKGVTFDGYATVIVDSRTTFEVLP